MECFNSPIQSIRSCFQHDDDDCLPNDHLLESHYREFILPLTRTLVRMLDPCTSHLAQLPFDLLYRFEHEEVIHSCSSSQFNFISYSSLHSNIPSTQNSLHSHTMAYTWDSHRHTQANPPMAKIPNPTSKHLVNPI